MRNWDYRFCWLRDATLTLLALMNAGYLRRGARLARLAAARGRRLARSQVADHVRPRRRARLTECELDWLPGYEDSRPVRIGNAAHGQLQLDVYGEVMDALYQAHRGGVPDSRDGWALQRALLDHLETIWQQPDAASGRVRGEPRHFTYSKVMAWVAFDRAIKIARESSARGPGRALATDRGDRSTTRSARAATTPSSAPSSVVRRRSGSTRACC